MIFLCATAFLSSVSAAYSLGGSGVPLAAAVSLAVLPLLCPERVFVRNMRVWLIPTIVLSSVARLFTLAYSARGALGNFGSSALMLCCSAVALYLAVKGKSALLAPIPVFVVTAVLALFSALVSLGEASPYTVTRGITPIELAIASTIPISAGICLAVNGYCKRETCIKGCCMGMAVFAAFLLFPAADAEFGFVSVPICVCQLALEFKTAVSLIKNEFPE